MLGSQFSQIFLPLRSRKTSFIPDVIGNCGAYETLLISIQYNYDYGKEN
ncbi:MAG: hypothetical protein ACTSUT_18260 [Promethearchaeota archaeon]